jgi:hypothetical protein
MGEGQLKRVIRSGNLTPEEVARDAEIRRQVQEEFPPARSPSPASPDSISETLKRAIKESHRSVDQISKDAGVSRSMVAQFLSGGRDIPVAVADKLASVLGLKLTVG